MAIAKNAVRPQTLYGITHPGTGPLTWDDGPGPDSQINPHNGEGSDWTRFEVAANAFAVPINGTITGVKVHIKGIGGVGQAAEVDDFQFVVALCFNQVMHDATGTKTPPYTDVVSNQDLGGQNDKWGEVAITPAQANARWGIGIAVNGSFVGAPALANVYAARNGVDITLYWTEPDSGGNRMMSRTRRLQRQIQIATAFDEPTLDPLGMQDVVDGEDERKTRVDKK